MADLNIDIADSLAVSEEVDIVQITSLAISVSDTLALSNPYGYPSFDPATAAVEQFISGDGVLPMVYGEGAFGMSAAGVLPRVAGAGVLEGLVVADGNGVLPKVTGRGVLSALLTIAGAGVLPQVQGQVGRIAGGGLLGEGLIAGAGILPMVSQVTVADGSPDGGGIGGRIHGTKRFDDFILQFERA